MFCPPCFMNWKKEVEMKPHYLDDNGIGMVYRCNECGSTTHKPFTRRDLMSKADPVVVKTVWETKAVVCQCCKFHSNKPSTCNSYGKSVGRKQDASECERFARR